jgi:phosphoserine phosphatase RsbU/P
VKLRTAILSGTLVLLIVLATTTVALTSALLGRRARVDLAAALERAQAVFEDVHAYRQSLFSAETLTVAQEPRLKAVVGTEDISRETVLDVARELQRSVGADLLLMLEADGRLLVDTSDPEAMGFSLAEQPAVAAALQDGDAGAVWTQGGRVFQVHARRISYGDMVVGALILGHLYDDRVATTVRRQTSGAVVVTLDGAVIAHAVDDPVLAEALAGAAADGEATHEATLLGRRYLVCRARLPGYTGERALVYTVAYSLDEALATSRVLMLWIVGLAALALIAAAGLAWAIARRIARPIDQLARFTREVAAGNLDAIAERRGPVEVRTLAAAMNDMVAQISASRRQLAATERLRGELEIANRIQTSILPRDLRVAGLDVAARMQPASEVGGDYYDVLPTSDSCWLGIGDVAGHGVTAGLVMLMVQSCVALLVHEHPDARPAQLLPALNTMLVRNIRGRLVQDEHVTFTLLRVLGDGRVLFAGAHEDILVCRAAGPCERVQTVGAWLGIDEDVTPMHDSELQLHPGDVMLLHTDGVTQAMNGASEQFGLKCLGAALERLRAAPVADIVAGLFAEVEAWTAVQRDDVTLLVVRYLGPPAPSLS